MYCSASQGIASLNSAWLMAGSDKRLTITAWPESAAATRARLMRNVSNTASTASMTAVGTAAAPSWRLPSGIGASPAATRDQPLRPRLRTTAFTALDPMSRPTTGGRNDAPKPMAASLRASLMPDLRVRAYVAQLPGFRSGRALSRSAETGGISQGADKNVIRDTNCRRRGSGPIAPAKIDNFSLGTYHFGLPFLRSG